MMAMTALPRSIFLQSRLWLLPREVPRGSGHPPSMIEFPSWRRSSRRRRRRKFPSRLLHRERQRSPVSSIIYIRSEFPRPSLRPSPNPRLPHPWYLRLHLLRPLTATISTLPSSSTNILPILAGRSFPPVGRMVNPSPSRPLTARRLFPRPGRIRIRCAWRKGPMTSLFMMNGAMGSVASGVRAPTNSRSGTTWSPPADRSARTRRSPYTRPG
mmetsp:Transcript_1489/g.3809  ORF Transcript_1489/g.3809 Transcript_1489/m.3809 type:complete len:213 (-) Transcript_1489:504-1142(-)